MSSEEEEARRIAEMGKPVLGEHAKIEIIIEESYEFKVHTHAEFRRLVVFCTQFLLCFVVVVFLL